LELQGQIAEALKYFDEALGVATALYDKNPNNSEWSRLRAAAHAKIGKALIALHPPQLDNAIVEIEKAIAIQARLVSGNPDDNAPFSNLAISHKTKADLLVRRSDRESALKEYMSAVTIWEALASKSPGDMRWQVYLAPTHEALGDSILERDPKAARLHYERAEAARRSLVEKSPNSASMQKELAAIQQKLNKLDVMSRTPEVTGSTQR
jgi:tetratricopeptide (TPR) repeat protein